MNQKLLEKKTGETDEPKKMKEQKIQEQTDEPKNIRK